MAFISKLEKNNSELKNIEDWVVEKLPIVRPKTSYHWWVEDTDSQIKYLIKSLLYSEAIIQNIGTNVIPVESMNEVYVSSKKNGDNTTSDTVFTTEHIDGPFWFLKGVSLFRVILAINDSDMYTTKITQKKMSITLSKGDLIGFDFNRSSHLIEKNVNSVTTNDRIVLKLHYLKYSKETWTMYIYFAIMCNILYDRIARQLFLYTLEPKSFLQRRTADLILFITKFWNKWNTLRNE